MAAIANTNRIIINNQTDLPHADVLTLVLEVVKSGHQSDNDKAYPYLSAFGIEGDPDKRDIGVQATRRKKTDSFTIYRMGDV
jgi:hypothetical protein